MGQPGEALQPYSGICLACNASVISLSDNCELVMFVLFSIIHPVPVLQSRYLAVQFMRSHSAVDDPQYPRMPSTWLSVAFAVHLHEISRGVDTAVQMVLEKSVTIFAAKRKSPLLRAVMSKASIFR